MKSDPYQGERWGGDVVFILSPSTYFDALVKQLKVQDEFRVIYRPSDAISG
jgi:hypothetical protein